MASLSKLIKEAIAPFIPRAGKENIVLTFEPDHVARGARVDPAFLSHDLSNILEHLISFTPEQGQIHVTLENTEENGLLLVITNTGINLELHSGVVISCWLPTRVMSFGTHGTRYEIRMDGSEESAQPVAPKKTSSDKNFYLQIQQRLQSHFNKTENLLNALKGNPREAAFLERVNQVIHDNLSNPQFDVNRLADVLHMSRTQLFRRLKPIIRQSASGYIRSLRLQKAKTMLETTDLRVSEAAFLTGFETPSNFSKVFSKAFGIKPSDIARNKSTETNGQENAT